MLPPIYVSVFEYNLKDQQQNKCLSSLIINKKALIKGKM